MDDIKKPSKKIMVGKAQFEEDSVPAESVDNSSQDTDGDKITVSTGTKSQLVAQALKEPVSPAEPDDSSSENNDPETQQPVSEPSVPQDTVSPPTAEKTEPSKEKKPAEPVDIEIERANKLAGLVESKKYFLNIRQTAKFKSFRNQKKSKKTVVKHVEQDHSEPSNAKSKKKNNKTSTILLLLILLVGVYLVLDMKLFGLNFEVPIDLIK